MASTPNSMLPGQGLAGKHRNPGLVWLVWPIRHTARKRRPCGSVQAVRLLASTQVRTGRRTIRAAA